MKKISIMLTLALSIVLVACDGSKKAPEQGTTPEVTAPVDTVKTVAAEDTMSVKDALVKYEATVKKVIPALLSMQKGDAKAIKEYQSLSKDINNLLPVLQKKAGEMTDKEAKKYKEIADMLYKATNPNAPKTETKKK